MLRALLCKADYDADTSPRHTEQQIIKTLITRHFCAKSMYQHVSRFQPRLHIVWADMGSHLVLSAPDWDCSGTSSRRNSASLESWRLSGKSSNLFICDVNPHITSQTDSARLISSASIWGSTFTRCHGRRARASKSFAWLCSGLLAQRCFQRTGRYLACDVCCLDQLQTKRLRTAHMWFS